MEFVSAAEVRPKVSRPLIGFRQQHAAGILLVKPTPKILNDYVGFGQILAIGTFALNQVRHGIEPETVHPHVEPELHDAPHGFAHGRVVVIEVGLMAEEAVPVILLRNRVPRPVGEFRIQEDDAGAAIPGIGIAPDVPVALGVIVRTARFLKPGVLVRGVVQHHLNDDANSALVGPVQKGFEVFEYSVAGVHRVIIGDVVAVIAQR